MQTETKKAAKRRVDERFFRLKEVADKLGHVTPRTVAREIERGKLEGIRIGDRLLVVSESALERYLEQNASKLRRPRKADLID